MGRVVGWLCLSVVVAVFACSLGACAQDRLPVEEEADAESEAGEGSDTGTEGSDATTGARDAARDSAAAPDTSQNSARDTGASSDTAAQPDTAEADAAVDTARPCTDEDGDGSPGTGAGCDPSGFDFDCDDQNRGISPRAAEVCDGRDNDCDGDVDEGVTNLCGGCSRLDPQPGQLCGECGQVECLGLDETRCQEGAGNACGGCESLTAVPGSACGRCGSIRCTGMNSVMCDDLGENACGGCDVLSVTPGESCGECGQIVCVGANAAGCDDPGRNSCGGCGTLDALPGAACGDCGEVVCDGANAVRCADAGTRTFWRDGDNDTFGVDGDTRQLCAAEGDYRATRGGDCDDARANINPDAAERCDDTDWDCVGGPTNGFTQLGDACDNDCGEIVCEGGSSTRCEQMSSPQRYYADQDNDGYGAPAFQDRCGPSGIYRALEPGDCNDDEPAMNPGEDEVCDGLNNDCDDALDEGDLCSGDLICLQGECDCLGERCFGGPVVTCCAVLDVCCDGLCLPRGLECP